MLLSHDCFKHRSQGVVTPFEQPRIRVGGQLAGVEQPDVEARRFSSCTLPLVWWPPGCDGVRVRMPAVWGEDLDHIEL